MTSLLSDMRTVRPKGRTFRITQPHGLRLLYLGTPLGRRKRLNRVYSEIRRCLQSKPSLISSSIWRSPPQDAPLLALWLQVTRDLSASDHDGKGRDRDRQPDQ